HGEPRIGKAEIIDPAHFRVEAHHLLESEQDAEEEYARNQSVQPRICRKVRNDLLVQDCCNETHKDQEQEHAPDKNLGSGQGFIKWRLAHGRLLPWLACECRQKKGETVNTA